MSRICFLMLLLTGVPATGSAEETFFGALRAGQTSVKLRYRYEHQQREGFSRHANAHSLLTRFDYQSAAWRNLQLALQLDWVNHIGAERFNDTRNGKEQYPVVPDPNGLFPNRFYLQWNVTPGLWLRGGRQCIDFEVAYCHRFAWRQNDPVYDALFVEARPLDDWVLELAHIWRVHTPLGPDEGIPDDDLTASIQLLRSRYMGWQDHRLTLVGLWLETEDQPAVSTDTFGVEVDGSGRAANEMRWQYRGRWLHQRANERNPQAYRVRNQFLELGWSLADLDLRLGYERLEGHENLPQRAFTRPLGARHALNGWNDQFVTTPATGLQDQYVQLGYSLGDRTQLQVRWHDFDSDATRREFGHEVDFLLTYRLQERWRLMLKAADYRADDPVPDAQGRDVRRYWVQVLGAF